MELKQLKKLDKATLQQFHDLMIQNENCLYNGTALGMPLRGEMGSSYNSTFQVELL